MHERADKERIADVLGASTTRPHPNGRCTDPDCTLCRHFRCPTCGVALLGSWMRLNHRCDNSGAVVPADHGDGESERLGPDLS